MLDGVDILDRRLRSANGVCDLVTALMSDNFGGMLTRMKGINDLGADQSVSSEDSRFAAVKWFNKTIAFYILPVWASHTVTAQMVEEMRDCLRKAEVIVGSSFMFIDCHAKSQQGYTAEASTTTTHMNATKDAMLNLIKKFGGDGPKIYIAAIPTGKCICMVRLAGSTDVIRFETGRTLTGPLTQASIGALAAGTICGKLEGLGAPNALGFGMEVAEAIYKQNIHVRLEALGQKLLSHRSMAHETLCTEIIDGLDWTVKDAGKSKNLMRADGIFLINLPYCSCLF
eukprot:Blabericola_migrator_1__1562@NODE_1412_length_4603_cov_85_831349_g939_i0_p2_GENE_NODE_1412_length_4603_cov_85_831349_g939_i0NODE_1412_length_4603_cov_85_831349_g939_i0_p2_ORF_typecomplete_len285_score47_97_NODE_1412_length_4603_cov_85_831349_g939_i09311785